MADDLTQIPVDDLIDRAVAAQRLPDGDEGWAPELQELTRRGTADIERRALGMLDDDDPARRTTGIRILRDLGHEAPEWSRPFAKESVEALVARLEVEPDEQVAAWLVSSISELGPEHALEPLLRHATHPSPGARYCVAGALARCISDEPDDRIMQTLIDMTGDSCPAVRWSAAWELAEWAPGSPPVIEALRHVADTDSDERNREVAETGLQRLGASKPD
jgi:HEAT repeat protein